MGSRIQVASILAAVLGAGPGGDPAALASHAPTAPSAVQAPSAPQLLSGTGLYEPGTLKVASSNLAYAPQYPLWSDGARKSRWVHLPKGRPIDVSDVDAWRFPAGTKFWKEFRFGGRRVETRLIWQARPGSWVFATYLWNEAQTGAALAPVAGVRDHVEAAPGKWHSIPSVADCRACHENGGVEVLGFSALQLSDDRDPLAPHAEPLEEGMVTLAALARQGKLLPARPELLERPPVVRATTPAGRAALGYLSANCGSCHQGRGTLAPLGLDLRQRVGEGENLPPAGTLLAGRRGTWEIPGAPGGETRWIRPGAPELSSILRRMASRRPITQMPPLGTVLVDEEAAALVRRWIEGESPLTGDARSAPPGGRLSP